MSWNSREGDTAPAFFERIYESFTKCNPEIVAEYERKGLLTKVSFFPARGQEELCERGAEIMLTGTGRLD